MIVIEADNIADAWSQGIGVILAHGDRSDSRNGPVLVAPCPVTTVYERPVERVLLDPVRDCNPFLHFFESLWMLAGRDDARWLDQFVSDFSSRFAEADGTMHGAYGRRWRGWFSRYQHAHQAVNEGEVIDQLDEVVRLLRDNSDDRQAVIQMWDPDADLGVPGLKDRPCNQQVMLRVRRLIDPRLVDFSSEEARLASVAQHSYGVLDITVTCRSNDVVWGCYGSNVVHFSMLQEYLAARIGVGVGRYYQVANNWHLYEATRPRASARDADRNLLREYPGTRPLVDVPERFDSELHTWMSTGDCRGHHEDDRYENSVFHEVATPMLWANARRRAGEYEAALDFARRIAAPDWRVACVEWLERRVATREGRS